MASDGFEKLFVIIEDKFSRLSKLRGGADAKVNKAALRQYLGVSNGKFEAWKKGQWPSAKDCALIGKKLGLSLHWLVTGEGNPDCAKTHPPEILHDAGIQDEVSKLQQRVRDLEDELIEERRLNRALTTKLLTNDKDTETSSNNIRKVVNGQK